jgi:hypothetical protein
VIFDIPNQQLLGNDKKERIALGAAPRVQGSLRFN